MQEEQLAKQNTDTLSDEEFLKNYEKHHKNDGRSNKYFKEKDSQTIKSSYWIFLAIVFIIAFYLFSKYLFIPQA